LYPTIDSRRINQHPGSAGKERQASNNGPPLNSHSALRTVTAEHSNTPMQIAHVSTSSIVEPIFSHEYFAEMRENAKKFLLLMHHMGYSYSEFSQESVDVRQLQDIYNDLNLPIRITPAAKPALPPLQFNNSSPAKPPAPSFKIGSSVPAPITREPVRENKLPTTNTTISYVSNKFPQNSTVLSAVAITPQSSLTYVKTAVQKANIVNPELHQSGLVRGPTITDAVLSKESDNKAPDRQDYIARLIAAKSKKSQAQRGTTPSAPPSPNAPTSVPQAISSQSSKTTAIPAVEDTTALKDEQAKK